MPELLLSYCEKKLSEQTQPQNVADLVHPCVAGCTWRHNAVNDSVFDFVGYSRSVTWTNIEHG